MALLKTLILALPLALAAPLAPRSATGSMTYYEVASGSKGACGWYNQDTELVCAISAARYDAGDHCGAYVTIKGSAGTVKAKVVDRCAGCGTDDVDLSPAAFQKAIGALSIGRSDATWNWA